MSSIAIKVEARKTLGDAPSHGNRFYRPELDVLRFLAFLCVFTVHALSMSPGAFRGENIVAPVGAYGMCLFFFLSAYLITELLRREQAATGAIDVRAFYVRRILRIWPLYFAFLLFGKVLGHFIPFLGLENGRLLAYLSLVGNWYLARFGSSHSPVEALWSISLEEQFYLVWPLLAKLGPDTLLVCSLVLLPIAWLTLYYHSGYQPSSMGLEFDGTIWCKTTVQAQFFALGAITAIVLRGRSVHLPASARIAAFALGFGVWLAASWLFRLPGYSQHLPGPLLVAGYILIGIGCLSLFLSFLGITQDHLPARLIYLGKISFGLYVFHILFLEMAYFLFLPFYGQFTFHYGAIVLLFAKYFVAFIPTLVAAWLSYRYFETPFLLLKSKFAVVPSR
jgi:peptidoglycan/LPS O-acetylase OafA/YrhL